MLPRDRNLRERDTERSLSMQEERTSFCAVAECFFPARTTRSALCNSHDLRQRRHGSPFAGGRLRPFGRSPVERFWDAVRKSEGCWEWIGARDSRGYGMFVPGPKHFIRAHVISFWMYFGAIPTGAYICHHCDNPSCVRPDHIYAGTAKTNARDMINRGRAGAQVGHVWEWSQKRGCDV